MENVINSVYFSLILCYYKEKAVSNIQFKVRQVHLIFTQSLVRNPCFYNLIRAGGLAYSEYIRKNNAVTGGSGISGTGAHSG